MTAQAPLAKPLSICSEMEEISRDFSRFDGVSASLWLGSDRDGGMAGPADRRRRFDGSSGAIAFLGLPLSDMRREMLCVAHLDSDNALIGLRLRYSKCVYSVELPIRTIVADALTLDSAALIVAHNHPGGVARPSAADLAATRALADVAGALGLRLHDHLVFAASQCFSFRAAGLL